MIVRKRWNAAAAFLVCAIVLIAVSTLVFGWHNNLDYIHVLSSLSRKAQSHYANQSMFGTLNRVIGNGENITYTPLLYTPRCCFRGASCADRRPIWPQPG